MPNYEIDFSFMEPGWGTAEFEADDQDQAEFLALQYIHDTYPGATDIDLREIKEIG